jgi:hypothetical protein
LATEFLCRHLESQAKTPFFLKHFQKMSVYTYGKINGSDDVLWAFFHVSC